MEPFPERTSPLRSVARLTGLSPEVVRAWERCHRAVSPLRTPGGTRRYAREVPHEDLAAAARENGAEAVALGVVSLSRTCAERAVAALRAALPEPIPLWVGGAAASEIARVPGIEILASLDTLERRVARIGLAPLREA